MDDDRFEDMFSTAVMVLVVAVVAVTVVLFGWLAWMVVTS